VEFTVTPVTVMPVKPVGFAFTVVPFVRLVPTKVTTNAGAPRVPDVGLIEVRVAVGGLFTVNVTVLLATPLGFVTMMFLPPSVAVPEIEKVAVS